MYSDSFSSDSSSSDIYFKKPKDNSIFNVFNYLIIILDFVFRILYSSSNVTEKILLTFLRSM